MPDDRAILASVGRVECLCRMLEPHPAWARKFLIMEARHPDVALISNDEAETLIEALGLASS